MDNSDKNLICNSIGTFLSNDNFLDFLKKAEPYLDMSQGSLRSNLLSLTSKKVIFEEAVQKGKSFSFGIIKEAPWESEIIKKRCASLVYFFGTDLEVCQILIERLFQKLPQDIFFIQHDSRFAPSHVEIALQERGFHTGAHYYSWAGSSKEINKSALKFANKFDIKSAKPMEANAVQEFAEFCEESWIDNFFHFPGRFVADPYLQKYGIKLYSNWARNSVLNVSGSDEVLICKIDNEMAGYVVLKYLDEKTVNLGILRINPKYRGKLVGVALQSASVGVPISKGVEKIVTRSAKFNTDNNKLLMNLGLKIIGSGIQFHFINRNHLHG